MKNVYIGAEKNPTVSKLDFIVRKYIGQVWFCGSFLTEIQFNKNAAICTVTNVQKMYAQIKKSTVIFF